MKKKRRRINKLKVLIFIVMLAILIFILWPKGNKVPKQNANNENNYSVANNDKNNSSNEITNSTNKKVNLSNLKEDEILGKSGLPVLMYHFFYDKSKGETARDGNWIEITDFENHLKYLTENNYYFPAWEEVSNYIDGKTNLPKKSIVLTVDDGDESFFNVALPVIKKYDVKVTEFLITSWNGWRKNDCPAKQMSYQSHSDSMHQAGSNGKSVMLSWSYDKMLEDCKTSRKILGDECITFCYPCGHYNDTAKKVLKDAGFKMAFTTEAGRVKPGADKFALPRIRTSTKTTVDVLKNLLKD